MAKISRKIEIQFSPLVSDTKVFNDWYDFADYIKQLNLRDVPVTIFNWRYI